METFDSQRNGFSAVFTRREHLFIPLLFLLLWIVILAGSGSLFSGYHLADDHEILTIQDDLLTHPVNEVIMKWFRHDFGLMHRFRPFYLVYRIFLTKWLGTNFTAWLFYTGIMAIGTTCLLYYGGRLTFFSSSESALFALLTLLGPQAVIWWSLGPNESIAMLLLSASWVCMLLGMRRHGSRPYFLSVSVLLAVLSALSKESFVLLFPALIFLLVWTCQAQTKMTWPRAWASNLPIVLVLAVLMLLIFLAIGRSVGFGGYGHHGGGIGHFDLFLLLQKALIVTFSFSTIGMGLIFLPCVFLLIIFVLKNCEWKDVKGLLGGAVPPAILFGLIVFPQFLIYSRCGIYGRYILPLMLGYTGLLIALLRFLKKNELRLCFTVKEWIGYLFAALAGLGLLGYVFRGRILSFLSERSDFLAAQEVFLPPPSKALMLTIAAAGTVIAGIFLLTSGAAWQNKRCISLYRFGLWLTVLLLFYKAFLSFAGAWSFAQHGRDTQVFFAILEKNTGPQDNIVLVVDPDILKREASDSIQEFARLKLNRPHTSFVVAPAGAQGCSVVPMKEMQPGPVSCVAIFSSLENGFLLCPPDWFQKSDYQRAQNGIFVTYFRLKRSERDMP